MRSIQASLLLAGLAAWILSAASIIDTRLAEAAQNQDIATVRTLLQQHVPVDGFQADGTTALLWAARSANDEMVRLLLAAGANPQTPNRYGETPLAAACEIGNSAIVERLIEAGADVTSPYRDGETPLMTAAKSGNVETVALLLKKNVNVNAKDSWQEETALFRAIAEGHASVVKLLIEHGADVNVVARVNHAQPRGMKVTRAYAETLRGGMTPLHFAARDGRIEILRLLLDAKANPEISDPDGITPLIVAILNAHLDAADLLLDRGASANNGVLFALVDLHNLAISDSFPNPGVTGAIGFLDLAKKLLDHGADPNLIQARKLPTRGVLGTLTGPPPGMSPLHRAARSADVEFVRLLLDRGADPKILGQPGTPMHAVLGGGFPGGPIGRPERLLFRPTPGPEQKLEVLKLCLGHGGNVNAVNAVGDMPLHAAAAAGNDDIVKFLLDNGARLDAKNRLGFTPLEIAQGKQTLRTPFGEIVGVPHETTVALLQQHAKGAGE